LGKKGFIEDRRAALKRHPVGNLSLIEVEHPQPIMAYRNIQKKGGMPRAPKPIVNQKPLFIGNSQLLTPLR
jgi:hypothetical protein